MCLDNGRTKAALATTLLVLTHRVTVVFVSRQLTDPFFSLSFYLSLCRPTAAAGLSFWLQLDAMEWTEDFIKVYSWRNGAAPSNIGSDAPDTSGWGIPTMHLKSSSCNIDKVFRNQRLIVNIALCGNPVADSPGPWDQCKAVTKSTCADYVRYNPSAFDNVYFKIKDIRIFGQNPPKSTSTTATSTTSTISTKTPTTSTESTTSGTSSSSTLSSTKAVVVTDATSTTPSSSTNSTTKASISSATGTSSKTASHTASTPSSTTTYEAADTTSVLNMSTKDVSAKTPAAATEFAAAASVIANASAPGISSTTTRRRFFNSNVTTTSSVEMMTTSTVYTTAIHTITSCNPTVTSCPIGKTTTLTIPLHTTVFPVSEKPAAEAPGSGHSDETTTTTTITTKVTKTYAITSCGPAVTDCPVGKVTTEVEVVTTTYCPGGGFTTQSPFRPTQTSNKATTVFQEVQVVVVPKPVLPAGGGQNGTTNATSVVKPRPSANGSVNTELERERPGPRPAGDNSCPGPECPPPAGISGASTQGIGLAMLIGGLAALLL